MGIDIIQDRLGAFSGIGDAATECTTDLAKDSFWILSVNIAIAGCDKSDVAHSI